MDATHTHVLIDLSIAKNQLENLKMQLKEEADTSYSKGVLHGLIEAYTAILLQPRIILNGEGVL